MKPLPKHEPWRLINPKDKDNFFRGPRIQSYRWARDQSESWRVQACRWRPGMWPFDEHELAHLLLLRWEVEQGQRVGKWA